MNVLIQNTSRGFKKILAALFSLCCIFLPLSTLHAQFYSVKTKRMNLIYYDKAHAYVIPHMTRCFENALGFHSKLFNYSPDEEIVVLLEDFDDYGYAGASSIPYNYLRLGIEPYKYVFDTFPTNERFNWVMNHELTHIVAADKKSSSDNFYRSLFLGKVPAIAEQPLSMVYSYLTSPRMYSPRWYHEGIAVFLETWMSGGVGRALGGYDEMVFRTMVRDSSYIYDVVGLQSEGTTIDFQVGANSYLYGTRFLSYLGDTYGPDKLLQWFSRTDESSGYFASQFENVYGRSLADAWGQWISWERRWQRANLDSIRLYPTTRYRQLSPRALGSVSRAFYDPQRRKIYAAVNYPGQLAHVAAIDIDRGTLEKVCNLPTPALYYVSSVAFDSSSGTFFFTTHNSADWRHLNAVNVRTGKSRRLIENARTGDLAFNKADSSLWGVQHNNGISILVRIPRPYDVIYTILPLDYGKDIFDIDISPDGKYLAASYVEISGKQRLIRMDISELIGGKGSYETLIEFDNNTSPENFVYSPDGRYLFGTSYYSGVSNVFRYDLETKKQHALTNAETGFFLPLPLAGDSLVVFSYTGNGFVPVLIANRPTDDVSAINYLGQEIVEKYPVVKSWKLGSPLSVDLDTVPSVSSEYHGMGNLRLQSAYPTIEGYKDYTSPGMRVNFVDPLQLNSISLSASYSPARGLADDERAHLLLDYRSFEWNLSAGYNSADFYDLFGPTKTSRKGYFAWAQYKNFLLYDKPETIDYAVRVAGYGGLEKLPDYQNVSASFDKLLTLNARLSYKMIRRSLGAVDDEMGVTWDLNSQNNYVRSKIFPLLFASVDYGFLLPIDHSFIWLRTSVGYSFREREDPFANFYFGGFGNNWVDHQSEKRYREYYSFPGVGLNDIGGTNFGKMMIEWTLPPLRFRQFGVPNAYCTWARLAFFSSGIVTNIDSPADRRRLLDAGAQVDFNLALFSRLESTLSLGYAVAMEKDQRPKREFMISLKIL